MARYIASRTKLSTRVGRNLFLKGARSFSAKDDYSKRPFKRSSSASKKRPASLSEFGKQLVEKQALKFSYGLQEKQLANIFKFAFSRNQDTGFLALSMLERRLDNVIYRGGMANSRAQARQLVSHGQFYVNGKPVNIPSFIVSPGDQITIKTNKVNSIFWKNFQLEVPNEAPAWLDKSTAKQIRVLNLPIETDLPQDFNMPYIVEFYSRKVS
jgi:small subunit ribosomal protein S4